MASSVLGIDFGTTNSAAAWIDEQGKLRMVEPRDGVATIPTYVWFDERGGALVGAPAKEMALVDARNTIYGFKRFLGKRYQNDFVFRHKDRFPFELCPGPNGFCAVKARGQVRTLEEGAFMMIQRLLELAQAQTKAQLDECVLTVPAHASFQQRRALRTAAEMAGLDVKFMINEPTAAAFSFLHATGKEGTFLVFDLGGGTFDATLLSLRRGLVEIKGTSGDAFLGGQDFDQRLVDHLVDHYQRTKNIDLKHDPIVMQRLHFAAEMAKIQLSSAEMARITVRAIARPGAGGEMGFIDLDSGIPRRLLEELCAPLIERCLGICEEILVKAGGGKRAPIEGVIFVGGQTRMPALLRRICDAVPADATGGIDPDTAVAAGAAVLGRGMHVVVDVVPMSVGMMVPGGMSQELIAPSSAVPTTRRMGIARPAAGPLVVAFYEATSSTATEREMLGSIRVDTGWLSQNPGDLTLDVHLDRNLDLNCEVKAKGGGALKVDVVQPKK